MVNITFIQENIPKHEILVNNIDPTSIIEVIPPTIDGVSFIYEKIKEHHNIESVHILSHGVPGKIRLGNITLDSETLENYSYLSQIQEYFVSNGELLLYACNLAATQDGRDFIDNLSNKTGLVITASTNIVGHSNLKGSWNLNYSTGNTNREVIVTEQGQSEWCDTLTHYRGGNLSWCDKGGNVIELIVTSYWRHDAHDEGLNVLFTPDVTVGNGVITNDIGFVGSDDDDDGVIDENGDENQDGIIDQPGDGGGTGTVGEPVEIDNEDHYTINTQTFMISYSESGNYKVTMSSGNRISTLQNGAADELFGMETIVIPGSGKSSPTTSIPPILKVPVNKFDWTYYVPASDPDSSQLNYTLPDTSSGGIYGNWDQIAGLIIDENTGELSLDTTGFTIGDLYTVVIEITDGSTTIPVDFIIEFVEVLEIPVISSADLNECVYAGLTYNYNFTASIPSDPTIALTWSELSGPVDNLSNDTSVQNQFAMTFSPNKSQIGQVYVVNLSVTNLVTGAISYLNITFTIKEAQIDDLINIFNCAIKNVAVECDKLNSLERILCLREKQTDIWKNGENKSAEHKDKLKKCKD